MEAKELRINNILFYDKEVVTIKIGDIAVIEMCERKKETHHYLPVPLTEEWLLKFHNEDEIEKSVRFPNEIVIYDRFLFIWKKEYKYWYVVTNYHKEYLTKIEFVHEYQQFIFALTGTELELK